MKKSDVENRLVCLEKGHHVSWAWEARQGKFGCEFLKIHITCERCGATGTIIEGKKHLKAIRLIEESVKDAELHRK